MCLLPQPQKYKLTTSLISMVPPPSSMVTSFDWSLLAGYRLPPYMPFHIIVHAHNVLVHEKIINEGTYVSIMSSTTCQALCSPHIVTIT